MTPLPLLRPTSVSQLCDQIAHASAQSHQVQLLGSNTMPLTRFHPDRPLQPISTFRLNKILDHAVSDMTISVEAGISLEALQKHLAWHNQWLPIDPPALAGRSPTARSLAGLIATNSLGPLRFGCGDYRMLLLGMRWINASGTLIKGGGRTVKNVAGYSSPRLLVGSLGALGAIAEVTLRTYPRPTDEQSLILFCNSPQQAEDILAATLTSPTQPAYIQAIGRQAFLHNPLQLPADRLMLAIGFLDRPELCAAQIATLRALPQLVSLDTITQTAPQSARLRLWMTTEPLGQLAFRLACLSSQVTPLITQIESLAAAYHATAWLVAEAANGLLRGTIQNLPPAASPAFYQSLTALAQQSNATLLLTASEDPTLPLGPPTPQSPLHARLKHALDPTQTFGP